MVVLLVLVLVLVMEALLTLAPQPYQDCQDVVKEVPYLAPEESCKEVDTQRHNCFLPLCPSPLLW